MEAIDRSPMTWTLNAGAVGSGPTAVQSLVACRRWVLSKWVMRVFHRAWRPVPLALERCSAGGSAGLSPQVPAQRWIQLTTGLSGSNSVVYGSVRK
jgi:hypothetical protein